MAARGDVLLLLAVLAVFGAIDAAYLTWEWYAAASATWCDLNAFFGCTKVRESPFSSVAGIPTATVGLVGFLVVLALSVLALRGTTDLGPLSVDQWLIVLGTGGVLIGAGLTAIEIFVIQAVCILCLFGFAIGIAILGLAVLGARCQSASKSE